MEKKNSLKQDILRALSYVLVAAVASMLTLFLAPSGENAKLAQIKWLIDRYYIGEYTEEDLYDGAAHGMIAGTGDQWSYYIPAVEYASYVEQMQNAYVGIGVTITQPEDVEGL